MCNSNSWVELLQTTELLQTLPFPEFVIATKKYILLWEVLHDHSTFKSWPLLRQPVNFYNEKQKWIQDNQDTQRNELALISVKNRVIKKNNLERKLMP